MMNCAWTVTLGVAFYKLYFGCTSFEESPVPKKRWKVNQAMEDRDTAWLKQCGWLRLILRCKPRV